MNSINQKTSNKLIAISVSIGLLFTACDPSKIVNQNNTITDQVKLVSSFSEQILKPTKVTITNNIGASIIGPGQSRLIIQPNTFIKANGQLVTGNVDIEFTDYTNRADMIFSRILPISNGEPLISGGEYNLKASQNGISLFLAPSKPVIVKIPQFGKSSNNMEFFRGKEITNIDVNAQNTVNWVNNKDTNAVNVVINGDTIDIFNDSCGLANADRFMTNPTYVEFPINLTGATTSSTTFTAYCMYKDFNGIWPMTVGATNKISASHIPNIPVHLVVFGFENGDFYSGILSNYTPANGVTANISLSKTDITTLKNSIKNLEP